MSDHDHAASQGKFLGIPGTVWTLILLAGGAILTTIDFVLAFRLHHLQPVLYLAPRQKIDLPPLEPVP